MILDSVEGIYIVREPNPNALSQVILEGYDQTKPCIISGPQRLL